MNADEAALLVALAGFLATTVVVFIAGPWLFLHGYIQAFARWFAEGVLGPFLVPLAVLCTALALWVLVLALERRGSSA